MKFATSQELTSKYPLTRLIKNLSKLQQQTGCEDAQSLDQDNPLLTDYYVATPPGETCSRLFREKPALVVRSSDNTIPYVVGYTAFALSIENASGKLFALFKKDDFEQISRLHSKILESSPKASLETISPRSSPTSSIKSEDSEPLFFSLIDYNINISDLDLASVLLELYNQASCEGPEYDNKITLRNAAVLACAERGKINLAQKLVAKCTNDFTTVDFGLGPRYLGIKVIANQIDPREYDKHHNNPKSAKGRSKAAYIIYDLKNRHKINKNKCCLM